ncbi:MAG: DciA family protein [Candidatus Omnitrophica bacterium]|nr:DciA family protein [Candidatus Omnitrophota bacterium]
MEAIKDTIQNVIESLASKQLDVAKNDPQTGLKKLLTKKELEHIKCNYFKKGTLSVNVDSSAWLYSLMLKKEELLVALKKRFNTLKDISFRVGDIK